MLYFIQTCDVSLDVTNKGEALLKDLTVLEAKRYGAYSCTTQTRLVEAARKMVEEDISRTIHVDSRYMLWVMDAVDDADNLLLEMGIQPQL